ncbi:baseplate J/gp47 family protein [Paenibacillus sp. GCM10027626]|uniref:baseplate assembly protein n=1 Tax=Paenibacillus sp. GCM10027626 TaxID=3273411 RepID=UPI003638D920
MNTIYDLPPLQLVDTDPEKIKNEVITVYEAIAKTKLFPGDPVRLFLYSICDMIIQQRVLINDTALQNLLRYARGPILDHIGASSFTPRLQATPALTTQRFHLSALQTTVRTIPAGTRVSPGNDLFFVTSKVAEIPVGVLHIDIPIECLETGIIGNGYLPGQIDILVDPLPYIDHVENITETSGGANTEEDDPYRERIYISPEKFSTAGPDGAYEYWARSAHPGIANVKVWSPSPVEVEVRVLMRDGELPSQEILEAVYEALNARDRRPLTDKVTVLAPNVVNYDINLTYWIDAANATEATQIQAAVQQAVNDYVIWEKTKIGRDVMPSELIRRIMNAGARRVAVSSPTYTVVEDTDVAVADEITVDYGGLEND